MPWFSLWKQRRQWHITYVIWNLKRSEQISNRGSQTRNRPFCFILLVHFTWIILQEGHQGWKGTSNQTSISPKLWWAVERGQSLSVFSLAIKWRSLSWLSCMEGLSGVLKSQRALSVQCSIMLLQLWPGRAACPNFCSLALLFVNVFTVLPLVSAKKPSTIIWDEGLEWLEREGYQNTAYWKSPWAICLNISEYKQSAKTSDASPRERVTSMKSCPRRGSERCEEKGRFFNTHLRTVQTLFSMI